MVAMGQSTNTKAIDVAKNCKLLGSDGKALTFGEILNQQEATSKRVLVIFIRHFFCGNCQEYIRRLSTDLAPPLIPNDLSIIVIGCGAPSLIESYVQITACPYPIYADPTTQLYKLLGMQRSLSLGLKGPAYIQHSLAHGMVKSIVQGLKRIPAGDVMQAGDLDVNGGEFLLEKSSTSSSGSGLLANWQISWSHCMMNSRDHAEIKDLKQVLLMNSTPSIEMEKRSRPVLVKHDSSGSIRRSLSLRRKSWIARAGNLTRTSSTRRTGLQVA